MGRPLDYEAAKALLDEVFALAETHARDRVAVTVPAPIEQAIERLFSSSTQAFREAVVGCALARILDNEIDVHLPYMNQGEDAFNGRTLDEQVVNPFLQEKGIPCSKGPLTPEQRIQNRQAERAKKLMMQRQARKTPPPPVITKAKPPSKTEHLKAKKRARKQRQRELKRVAIFEKFVASKNGLFDPQNPSEKSQNTDQGNTSHESNTSLA